ncbi:MAG: hypothetical protein IH945_00060 [Armatimonadetes bacterium]|nr:hypothetical protein [Armatimonadota bacterium]
MSNGGVVAIVPTFNVSSSVAGQASNSHAILLLRVASHSAALRGIRGGLSTTMKVPASLV